MILYWLPFLFTLGLGVGSFINVLSIRYNTSASVFKKTSLLGRSHCVGCKKILRWFELVPLLSFFIQLGKCRLCKTSLSYQYPVVELITALLFVYVPVRIEYLIFNYGNTSITSPNFFYLTVVLWLLLTATLILIGVIDFKTRLIPDELNIFIVILGFILIGAHEIMDTFGLMGGSLVKEHAMVWGFRGSLYINHILAFLVAVAFFGIIIIGSKGRAMGMGDLKLSGALGIFLGWPDIVISLSLAFIIGSIISLFLIVRKKKGMKDAVPFAPFIVAGVFSLLFFGQELLTWYFGIFQV